MSYAIICSSKTGNTKKLAQRAREVLGDKVVDDVADLIEKSYIKPLETDKRFFVIDRGETMSAAVQNKLLKTLDKQKSNVI